MDELLNKISDDTGVPTDLLERAAQARAAAAGVSADALVAQWAGEAVPESAAAAPAALAPAPTPAPAAAPAETAPEPEAPSGPVVEVLEPTAEPPVPASDEGEPEFVAAGSGFPRWLSAAFLIIPLLAISYALLTPNGPTCGTAGALAVDPVSGEAANCDGTEYGVDVVNFFTLGESLYEASCASCHGSAGQGGTGPTLAGGSVLATFPSCDDHLTWVKVGTDGWAEETGSSTYGALGTPVGSSGAKMPGFVSLTDDELREVVLYERVAFGQEPYADSEAACGLADPALASG
jgi:hypothetical protein